MVTNHVKNQGNEYNKLYQGEMVEGQMSLKNAYKILLKKIKILDFSHIRDITPY